MRAPRTEVSYLLVVVWEKEGGRQGTREKQINWIEGKLIAAILMYTLVQIWEAVAGLHPSCQIRHSTDLTN